MRPVLVSLLICLGPTLPSQAGDETEAVKKAVLGPQEAGWGKNDFKSYMSQWADDARIVIARGEQPGKHDLVFDRKQIEATRRIIMSGKPPPDRKVTFENAKVTFNGNEAALRVRATIFFGENYEIVDEIYRLRKTQGRWKVIVDRGWPVKSKYGDETVTYNADTWKKLDNEADELVRTDRHGAAAEALSRAYRFREAHALLKKVTAKKDATVAEWLQRGHTALAAGDAADAVPAFRKALELDAKAPVPEYIREIGKK